MKAVRVTERTVIKGGGTGEIEEKQKEGKPRRFPCGSWGQ